MSATAITVIWTSVISGVLLALFAEFLTNVISGLKGFVVKEVKGAVDLFTARMEIVSTKLNSHLSECDHRYEDLKDSHERLRTDIAEVRRELITQRTLN